MFRKVEKHEVVGIDAQRSNVGVSFFIFFQKYPICVFLRTCKFCMFSKNLKFSLTNTTYEIMRFLGASLWILLGACLCLLGACLWIGWVHVCGCWVQSMRLRLGACLIVGSLPDSR